MMLADIVIAEGWLTLILVVGAGMIGSALYSVRIFATHDQEIKDLRNDVSGLKAASREQSTKIAEHELKIGLLEKQR